MALITTTKGLMDESLLTRREGEVNDDREHTNWVEYWDGDELVHRSAIVRIKDPHFAEILGGIIG